MINFLKILTRKTVQIKTEGITATEQFQKVCFKVYENIEKTPSIIKGIFLSNIIRRTFSHRIFQTIDEKEASFFPKNIKTKTFSVDATTTTNTFIYFTDEILSRQRLATIQVANYATTGACSISIVSNNIDGTVPTSDIFFMSCMANTVETYTFSTNINFSIKIKQTLQNANVKIIAFFTPL